MRQFVAVFMNKSLTLLKAVRCNLRNLDYILFYTNSTGRGLGLARVMISQQAGRVRSPESGTSRVGSLTIWIDWRSDGW